MTAIRLIGEHHTSRRRQTVLTISDETAARNSPRIVTLEHARNLVAEKPPTQQDHPMPKILNRTCKIDRLSGKALAAARTAARPPARWAMNAR
jgi:hypothetical protein